MTLQFVDTHAHLDEAAFATDRDEVLTRAGEAGVSRILTIGITVETSRNAVELAARYDGVYAVVGIQPNYVSQCGPDDFAVIEQLAEQPGVVGIGETGLDRYWDYAPIELQQEYFRRHIELSVARSLPFVVHCREAETDTVNLLTEMAGGGTLSGVMHSFCGDQATADACLNLGLFLSFAGMVTYRKNEELREVARRIPAERLLIETDSPYLTPVPLRGKQKRNEPANVQHTAACVAEARGMAVEDLAALTTANAERLFRLPAV